MVESWLRIQQMEKVNEKGVRLHIYTQNRRKRCSGCDRQLRHLHLIITWWIVTAAPGRSCISRGISLLKMGNNYADKKDICERFEVYTARMGEEVSQNSISLISLPDVWLSSLKKIFDFYRSTSKTIAYLTWERYFRQYRRRCIKRFGSGDDVT